MTIHAGILAGGAGSRMGGADKGLLDWHGQPLVARIAEVLKPQVAQIWISANRHQAEYQVYGQTVADPIPGLGPLAGLRALRQASTAEWLLTVPCDTWPIPHNLAQRMLNTTRSTGKRLGVVVQGDAPEWCVLCVHRDLLPDLAASIEAGVRSMQDWCARHAYARIEYGPEERWFINLNTPQQWADAKVNSAGDEKNGR